MEAHNFETAQHINGWITDVSSAITYNRFTALWILSGTTLPGCASMRKNIHQLTPILIVNHHLSASSICCNPWHLPGTVYMPGSLFAQPLTKSSWVYLLVWHPPLHIPCISSPNHYLIFTARSHAIATCFAVVQRLYHLILVSLSPVLGTLSCILMLHIHLTILVSAQWSATSFSFLTSTMHALKEGATLWASPYVVLMQLMEKLDKTSKIQSDEGAWHRLCHSDCVSK